MSIHRLLLGVTAGLCATACGLAALPAGAVPLPDGRVYELITPQENYGAEVYQPYQAFPSEEYHVFPNEEFFQLAYLNTQTAFPFQAAADGDKVAYVAGPTVGGSETSGFFGGNEYLGTRSATGGWTQSNISPVGASSAIFQAFSSDLSIGFLDAVEALSPEAPGFGKEHPKEGGSYDVLYSVSTAGGTYVPFFTITPPNRTIKTFKTAAAVDRSLPSGGTSGERLNPERFLAFEGSSADSSHLLFEADDALTPEAEGGSASNFESEDNLYEADGGLLRLVNILPDGSTHVHATFGGGPLFSRVISADGSRVFWTDLSTGHIYVRENGTKTVEISSAGQYQTASSDGSKVFFTNGDLYEYELESGQTIDLTPGVTVDRVLGASENGSYVYYTTTVGNLELWHEGAMTRIGPTSVKSAEVTPDGHSIVFGAAARHIEVYDADTGHLYCASCGSGGVEGYLPQTSRSNVYQDRWMSADGSRVFFDSPQALVPQDTNGLLDVYEWERPGSGGCEQTTGCIYLLSGGTSTEESYFADASVTGDDVFIVTRASLVPRDQSEAYDLYDARVDGVVPPAPPACTGTGCQGIPGAPPIFSTPSSVTFNGVGNFPPPSPVVKAKQKPKKKPRKHKRKAKARRHASKAAAHRRSGRKGGPS